MPVAFRPWTLLSLAIVWSAPATLRAQADALCTLGINRFAGTSMLTYGKKVMPPFSATVKFTDEQRLADGNLIHGTVSVHEARDSAGRTRQEYAAGCERGEDGRLHMRLSVNVFDPVEKTTLSWQVGLSLPKVARLMRPQLVVPKQLTPEELAEQQSRMKLMQSQQTHQDTKREQLGTRSINGVLAEGVRTTSTVPAGEMGNDLPLVTVRENWTSRDLGIQVLTIVDDPRTGKTTTELQDINLSEPDASLFAPPPGYKVEEQHPPEQPTQSQ